MRALLAAVLIVAVPMQIGCGGCPRSRGAHLRSSTHPAASDIAIEEAIVVDVVPGPPLVGELEEPQVHAVATSQASDVQHCLESARAEHPALTGEVAVDLAIAADGDVSAAALAYNETGDGVLGACLVSLVEHWHFPASAHGARVRIPFAASEPPPEPQPDAAAPTEAERADAEPAAPSP